MSPAIEKVELPLSPPITTPTAVLPETEGVAEPGEENRGPDTSWPKILQEVKKKKISLYAFLQSAEFRLDEDSQAVLVFGPECAFHKESVERRENTELLKDIIESVQGRRCRLECVLKKSSTAVPALSDFGEAVVSDSAVAGNGPREKKVENSFQEFSSNGKNPLVEVTELFSGLVVEYSSTEEHIKGGWEESDFEKSDEGSPENAGQDGQNPGGVEK
ncbi:MAG: hypothetical protein WCP87_06030 [Atribacterota bacterium]